MFSRRTRFLLAILVVASLTFVILDLRGGEGPFASVRAVGANVLGGLERAAATVFSPITGAGSWWSTMRDQSGQITDLTRENQALRSELEQLTNDKARAAALDGL
ncbi:MAG: rod shape-determining protein MreC, partial [Actinomycetota bacterium]|nr:rod shape-determining protein MreC [Actinomycetota bacterium]